MVWSGVAVGHTEGAGLIAIPLCGVVGGNFGVAGMAVRRRRLPI